MDSKIVYIESKKGEGSTLSVIKQDGWTSPNLVDKLTTYLLPNRCFLCGKWKLFGANPNKKCIENELRMD